MQTLSRGAIVDIYKQCESHAPFGSGSFSVKIVDGVPELLIVLKSDENIFFTCNLNSYAVHHAPGHLTDSYEVTRNSLGEGLALIGTWLDLAAKEVEAKSWFENRVNDFESHVEAFIASNPGQEYQSFSPREAEIWDTEVRAWETILKEIEVQKSISLTEFNRLLLEMERLRESLLTDTKGKWWRSAGVVLTKLKKFANHPLTQQLALKIVETKLLEGPK